MLASFIGLIFGACIVLNPGSAKTDGKELSQRQRIFAFLYEEQNSSEFIFDRMKPLFEELRRQQEQIVNVRVISGPAIRRHVYQEGIKEAQCSLYEVNQMMSLINPDIIVCLAEQYSLSLSLLLGRQKGLFPSSSSIYAIFGKPFLAVDDIHSDAVHGILEVINLSDKVAVTSSEDHRLLQRLLEGDYASKVLHRIPPISNVDQRNSSSISEFFEGNIYTISHKRIRRDANTNSTNFNKTLVTGNVTSSVALNSTSLTASTTRTLSTAVITWSFTFTPSVTLQLGANATLKPYITPSAFTGNTTTKTVNASATSNGTYFPSTPTPSSNSMRSTLKTSTTAITTQAITTTQTVAVTESSGVNSAQTPSITVLTPVETLISSTAATTVVINETSSANILITSKTPLPGNSTALVESTSVSVTTYLLSASTPPLNLTHSTVIIDKTASATQTIVATSTASVIATSDANSTLTTNITQLPSMERLTSSAMTTTVFNATSSAMEITVINATSGAMATTVINATSSTMTTTVFNATSSAMTTTVFNATSSAMTTTVINATSSKMTTTVFNGTSSAMATTVINATSSAMRTTVFNATSSAMATTVINATSSAMTTTVFNATSSAMTTTVINATSSTMTTTIFNATSSVMATTVINATSSAMTTTVFNATSSAMATTVINATSSAMTTTVFNATSIGIELTTSKTPPPGNSTNAVGSFTATTSVENTSSVMATLTTNATKSTQSLFVTSPTTLNFTRSVVMTTDKTYMFVNRTIATVNITYSFVLPTTSSFFLATPTVTATGSSSVQDTESYSTVFTTGLTPQSTSSLRETMPSHVSLSKTTTQGLTVATFATSMSAQQPTSTNTFVVPTSTLLPSSVPSTSAPVQNKTYIIEMQGECEENFQKCQFAARLEQKVFAVVNVSTAQIVTNDILDCTSGIVIVTLSVLNVVNTSIESSYKEISFVFRSHDFRAKSSPERVSFSSKGIDCDVKFKLTLEGDCTAVTRNQNSKNGFSDAFKEGVSKSLGVKQNKINVESINCGSVEVIFTVKDGKKTNITKQLEKSVEDKSLVVNYSGKTFAAKSVEVVEPATPTQKTQVKKQNQLTFILYVTFGALMGVIFLVGVLVLVVRCHRDRVVRGFSLNPDADLELRGFTAIPRANYYQVDYYGGPQEIDASRGDADVDEFGGDVGPITHINGPPKADANGKANKRNTKVVSGDDAVNDEEKNQDEFAMGNLPKWDLPKLGKSEVAVSPKENNKAVGTTFGSKENLVNDDNKQSTKDTSHSYVNPALDVSEIEASPPDDDRQVTASDTSHAYENPALSVSELESEAANTTAD